MAGISSIGLVEGKGDEGVDEDPAVELPFWGIGDFVCFLMDGDVFVKVDMMDVEEFEEPVGYVPLVSIPLAPGGFH